MSATDASYEADDYPADEEEGLSGLFILLMGVLIVSAFGAVVWMAYQQGVRNGRGETGVPYVQADPGPLKIEHARRDDNERALAAYDVIDEDAAPEEPEVLVSRTEEPVLPTEAPARRAEAPSTDDDASDVAALPDEVLTSAIADAEINPPAETPSRSEPEVAEQSPPARRVEPTPTAATPERRPAPTTSAPTAGTSAPARRGAVDPLSGDYVVQVASLRSASEADQQWSRLVSAYPDFTEGYARHVETATIEGRGTYHRLQVGPFTDKTAANAFCAGLKERGRDCLVKPTP